MAQEGLPNSVKVNGVMTTMGRTCAVYHRTAKGQPTELSRQNARLTRSRSSSAALPEAQTLAHRANTINGSQLLNRG